MAPTVAALSTAVAAIQAWIEGNPNGAGEQEARQVPGAARGENERRDKGRFGRY